MYTTIYLPVFLFYYPEVAITPTGWLCIVATGIIHGVYFWCMGGAYQRGDLSLVYPPVYIYLMLVISWLIITP